MSKRQDRQGVRTPADVERKYNLGGLRDMMSRIAAEASGAEGVDALSKEVEALGKVVENTASEMWQTQGEMQESLENMQDDMTIVKQDFLNTADKVDDLKEDMTPLAEFSDGEYSGVVGFVARANADSAMIATLLEFSQDDDISLAMFMAEASKEFATIESVTLVKNNAMEAISGLRTEAAQTYAEIATLASYVTKEAQTEAIAGLRSYVDDNCATNEMLASYVTKEAQTEAIAGVRSYVDDNCATNEVLAGYVSESEQTKALAGLRSEVANDYVSQTMLSTYKNEQAQAMSGVREYVDQEIATRASVTQLQTAVSDQKTAILQEVSEGYASVSQIAEVVDENGNVSVAAIVSQINEGKSSILLSADAINLEGYATFKDVPKNTSDLTNDSGFQTESGVTTIVGGVVTTDFIEALNIKVSAAQITDTLTIGQLPSTVAETSDIPTNVSELTNDSGFQNASGVTTIVNGVVTTDFVNALGITAKHIDVDSLSAISANIGEVTAGIIRSENPCSAVRIDLTNGTMSMNGLTLDAMGNLSVEGEIRAKSGYIGSASEGFAINSKYISGNGKPSDNGGTANGVYIGADGIGRGRGAFWVNDAGYLHTASGSIGNLNITDTGLAWGDVFTLDETGVNYETTYTRGSITYHDRTKIYDGGVYSQLEETENGVTVGNKRAGSYSGTFFLEKTPASSINSEHQIMRVKLGQTDYEIYVNTQTMTLGFRKEV